jgi:putative flippase GtrA
LSTRVQTLLRELTAFGVVGAASFVIDVGIFNLLRFAGQQGPLYDKPLTAKVISVAVATTFSYAANRSWTFRRRARSGVLREYVLFVVLNAVGMGIAVGCLAVSHYLLGFTSPLADNISANVVGLLAGMAFRFWSYRRWVFLPAPASG